MRAANDQGTFVETGVKSYFTTSLTSRCCVKHRQESKRNNKSNKHTVKPMSNGHSQKDGKLVFKTNFA